MEKLVIEAGNNGDRSVGIPPLDIKIIIEANCDMRDVLDCINYPGNFELFRKDIQNLIDWIDDMECRVYSIKAEWESDRNLGSEI